MARKETIVKPFFEVYADYENSLKNFVQKANMMASTISTALSLDSQIPAGQRMNGALRESLEKALNDFDAAR